MIKILTLIKNSVDFINKYIFPGSCLISVSQISDIVKNKTKFDFIDLEDITLHYAKTLNIWRKLSWQNKRNQRNGL